MELKIGGVSVGELAEKFGTPIFVYDEKQITKNIDDLKKSITYPKFKIKYACKANTNLAVLKLVKEAGLGIDAVSTGEVFLAQKAGFKNEDILFTGDNSTEEEFQYCKDNQIALNIGSLFQLELFGKKYPGSVVMIRLNPDVGAGHHDHCITGGPESKFGIYIHKADEAKKIASQYNLKIKGIHSHIGSGILDPEVFMEAMNIILDEAKFFENLDVIDIGGGLGVPYHEGQKPLDLKLLGDKITKRMEEFNRSYGKEVTLYMEPGRYIVANAGYLLAQVVNKKSTPLYHFVGVNSGFNHLIRPMAYGSHHRIVNGSKIDSDVWEEVMVAGNLCESGDVFTKIDEKNAPYKIQNPEYGDILVIKEAGAYGFSMSSNYNSRLRPAEVMACEGKASLIRKAETFEDLLRGQII
ncbi:MAG TPA: diaminopimelate decarboxylase [Spirochaetia bacterium]|nr:MAG: diaminopimelate decarboxylase [Spirochaetes bacterium GWB1_36_13]HCL56890.1 diaminopimelate decarboxylase [Spirochaetia bacterium]